MTITAKIECNGQGLTASLRTFFKSVLEQSDIQAILVPMRLPAKQAVMPTLISDPEKLENAEPLAPCFPLNAARLVARLSRKPIGGKIAVVLRPCEIRAFVELVKLKQGRNDELVLIGIDCLGAYQNRDYAQFANREGALSSDDFCQAMLNDGKGLPDGMELSPACLACEHPIADNADLSIGLVGVNTQNHLPVTAQTETGETLLKALELPSTDLPADRKGAVEALINKRSERRDAMLAETAEAVNSVEKMSAYFAACVNCYNCRVACPVCYCKECVFVTGAFDHDPAQYLGWASRKGLVKMPTDTVFYHITRLAHMSTACVGCGQCTNACPNDIPVMEVFRLVAQRTQSAFGYTAGKNIEEAPPLSVFRENEYQDVVGIE